MKLHESICTAIYDRDVAHCGNNRCLLNRMLVCQILSAFCTEFLVRFVPLDQEMCHN